MMNINSHSANNTPRPWSSSNNNGSLITRNKKYVTYSSPREAIALTGESDKYILDLAIPAPARELRSFRQGSCPSTKTSRNISDLPGVFKGYRHTLSPRPDNATQKYDKEITVLEMNRSSSPTTRRGPKAKVLQSKAECNTMRNLNKRLQDEIAKTAALKTELEKRDNTIRELQRTILIERQQNRELTQLLEQKSSTDKEVDDYLKHLLLSEYQSSL